MILALATAPALAATAPTARAIDHRFDVATDANTADNKSWFGSSQLPALNFPSVHGHDIEQSNTNHQSAITAAGNTLSIYYNNYNTLFPTQPAATAVSTVNSYCTSRFGSAANTRWLVLNEVDAATWNGTDGDAYRAWLIDTCKGLSDAGYKNIILYSPRYLASKTYQTTWQTISGYANIGVETYLDGRTIKNSYNYSLSKVQAYYQGYYNSWTSATSGAGLSASKVFAGEHFSVNVYDPTYYWGANGTSGDDWRAAVEIRDIAIHNIPFGGFIGYAWQRDDQATGDDATDLAAQLSYERAYASTLVVQSEVPTWTGNDRTTSWADYLNWTGGLPSTTSAPYPLLAATNPTLPKQTTANLFNTVHANTTITLDGNQSVTHIGFDSPYSYTIAPGTGGTLTLTGSGASISITSGSHVVTAGLTLAANVAASLTGNLNVSGALTNSGFTLTKSGGGTLTISGPQQNAPNSALVVSSGTVIFNSDAGTPASRTLALTASSGSTTFNVSQHLHSLGITGGAVTLNVGGSRVIVTDSVAASGIGKIDLKDNRMIVRTGGAAGTWNGTSYTGVTGLVQRGRNGGGTVWTGTGVYTSMSSARSSDYTALGVATASQVKGIAATATATGVWSGETVTGTDTLVMYTYGGDANLDGVINIDDYTQIDSSASVGGVLKGWFNGDFNYDGSVDIDDYTIIDSNVGIQGAPFSTAGAISSAATAVPEPMALWSAGLSAAALTASRHRHRRRP